MWYLIIYFSVFLLITAVINRYCKEHPEHLEESDYDFMSDRDAAVTTAIFWPIVIPIGIFIGIVYCIYKVFYYVVDKIYTKIVSIGK